MWCKFFPQRPQILAAFLLSPWLTFAQIKPGVYAGDLSCGELAGTPSRPGWTDKVQVEISASTLTWTRQGVDHSGGRSEYREWGVFHISPDGKALVEAEGRYLPNSNRTGSWITRGDVSVENGRLVGAKFAQLDSNRSRVFRHCTVSIPVRVTEPSMQPATRLEAHVSGQTSGQTAPFTPSTSLERAKSLPEPLHGKVRAAALLPDPTEASKSAIRELQQGGFFDGLPRMNDRDYYRCSREGAGWLHQATSSALNAAVMTEGREQHQRSFDSWGTSIQSNCDSQFWSVAKSRLSELTVSLTGTNKARIALAEKARVEELSLQKRNEEKKIEVATEKVRQQSSARQEREAAQAAQRESAEAVAAQQRVAAQGRASELKSGKAKIESLNDAVLMLDAKSGHSLYLFPAIGPRPGAYQFGGILKGSYGDVLHVAMGRFNYTVEITKNTKFLSKQLGELRVGSYVMFVGGYLGAESSNGETWATFRAQYVQ